MAHQVIFYQTLWTVFLYTRRNIKNCTVFFTLHLDKLKINEGILLEFGSQAIIFPLLFIFWAIYVVLPPGDAAISNTVVNYFH